MADSNVKVVFSADDQATEVARKLLDTLRGIEREQKAAAAAAGQLAAPTQRAAAGFEAMRKSIAGLRDTGGVDAISKRVALLSEGLRSASTRGQSLTQLTAAEGQLQKALQRSNLSLTERIRLERELRNARSAIAGGNGLDVPPSALSRFQQLHGALLAIAAALGAIRLLGFAKNVVDAADSLHDLSTRTGVSVESLSVLTQEAEKAGASTDTVQTAFRNLAKSVEELRAGNQDAVASFAALGLSAADLKGLGLDQVLVKIADAQDKFADGSGKAAVATKIFGRSGDEILPLLNQLANGGFQRASDAARSLGSVMSTEAANAADEFNDSLSDLKSSLAGFAIQLTSALGPLADLVRGVTGFLASIPGGVKAFAAAAVIAGAAATALAGAVGALVIAFGALATVTGVGAIVGAILAIAGAAGVLAAHFREARQERDRLLAPLNKDPQLDALLGGGRPTIVLQDPAQLKALRQARLAAARQQARDEQSIEDARLRLTEQVEQAAFAQGLTGLRTYFQNRAEIAKQGTALEVRALQAELIALRASPLAEDTQAARVQRAQEIASLEAKIAVTKQNGETALLALVEQERVAREQAFQEAQQFQAQIFRLQGQELQATQIEIAQAADRFAKVLTSLNINPEIITQLRTAFSTLLTDRAAFESQNRVAEQQLQGLAQDRARVEQAVATGILSQRDGLAANLQLERQRIPALQQAADAMKFFADRVQDPALQAAAAALQQQINGIGVSVQQSALLIANFKDNLLSAAQSEFATFLGSTINNVKSLGDAFRQLGASIVGAFQRVAAELIATKIFEKIGSLFGLGIGNGSAALAKAGVEVQKGGAAVAVGATALLASAVALQAAFATQAANSLLSSFTSTIGAAGFASGGPVRGPGTGTSDSILARLSAGEFVIRAAVVQQLGLPFLTALNGLKTPRLRSIDSIGLPTFADGGLVTATPAPASKAREDRLHLAIDLGEDVVIRHLKSTRGIKALTEAMQANRGQFRAVLG